MKISKRISIITLIMLFITLLSQQSAYASNFTNKENQYILQNSIDEAFINNDVIYETTENGFILEYMQFENEQNIYYKEECRNDVIYTDKFLESDGELILIEQLVTVLKNESDNIVATITNLSNGSKITETIISNENILNEDKLTANTINSASIHSPHPRDYRYMKVLGTSGHVGWSNVTRAAIVGAISSKALGGPIIVGGLVGVATEIINNGWSSLYYQKDTYYPNHKYNVVGLPISKTITYFYRDRNRTSEIRNSPIYSESNILVKVQ